MAAPQEYQRDKDGVRFQPGGISTVNPLDNLPPNKFAYLQNIRAYRQQQIIGRATVGAPVQGATLTTLLPPVAGSSSNWTNPANATSDTLYASYGGGVINNINVSTGALAIPLAASIIGVQIAFEAYTSTSGFVPTLFVNLNIAGTAVIQQPVQTTVLPYILGGQNYTWGLALTPSILNAGFAVQFSAQDLGGATMFLNSAVITVYYAVQTPIICSGPPYSLAILNDTTPDGPIGQYVRVIGAAGQMYVNAASVASGFTGNPVSICPFRPNASVQPWAYIGDSSPYPDVTIAATPTFHCAGAVKIRSDGLTRKTGVEEPQVEPTVSTQNTVTTGTDNLPATTIPWTNVGGVNSDYNYGQTNAGDGTQPVIITGGATSLIAGSTITLTVTGTATVNGTTHAPGDSGPTSSTYPGAFIAGSLIVVGAFTDASGNVVPPGGSLPLVFSVGSGTTVTVPANASQLHIGIDSSANNFSANSGAYSIAWSVTVPAIATVISTVGNVTAYVWGTPPPTGGGSPHSGPVANYIWRNPNDTGSGTSRSITNPVPDASPTNNSWDMLAAPPSGGATQAVAWDTLNSDGSVANTIPLFSPALETEGYQDFNSCIVGSLFVPAGGNYTFTFQYKDQIMVGFTKGVTATYASGASPLASSPIGSFGQTISVVNALPLVFVSNLSATTGAAQTTVLTMNFPDQGVYDVEIDWDYWDKDQATMIMQCNSTSPNSPTIPPVPAGVRTEVQYRYVYRASETGALSNPSPESPEQATPVLANTVQSVFSNDPQVDKVDYYRLDSGLTNFTYVATGPNDGLGGVVGGVRYNTPITDELTDLEIADNPILAYDNYEPFPVIDLPKKGVINVTGGAITLVSGDEFNTRWLPGTEILIGFPTATAYVLVSRPTSTGTMTIPGVPDGTNLSYEIPEPDLAAQPLQYIWGPTDNAAYMFGVGDELNPGTLYFTQGNNPDSAPQTNQIPVTSPDEPLMNGVKTAAESMVWSTERRFLIYPTFTTALATVQGVTGTPFNVVEATGSRGLYIAPCVCTDGGRTAFFRAKDGIYACEFGGADECLTNDIYNLFPREGIIPQPITIAGNTIYPPDDTKPNAQKLAWGQTVLFYDYEDTTGTPRTLVFDLISKGWSVDVGQYPFTAHAWEQGPNTDTVMVGCLDGSVRVLGTGTEICTSVVIPGAQNGGDARAFKRVGDIFIKAIVQESNPITIVIYANRYTQLLAGFTPTSLVGTGSLLPYIIDFSAGYGNELIDVGVTFSWQTITYSGIDDLLLVQPPDLLDLWAPTFTFFPEATQDRPTAWEDAGYPGNKFVQGLLLEMTSFGNPKAIAVQRSDDFAIFVPNESPITSANQRIIPFTFTPPFLAHQVRIISTDGVLWRHGPDLGWRCAWQVQPFPEATVEWATELTSLGGVGWQHLRLMNMEYISTAAITLAFAVDTGNGSIAPATITLPSSSGTQTKLKLTMTPNKWKLISFAASSTAPMNLFIEGFEVWVRSWGASSEYRKLKPFGAQSSPAANV